MAKPRRRRTPTGDDESAEPALREARRGLRNEATKEPESQAKRERRRPGAVRIVESSPEGPSGTSLGRRAEPTRFDAMPIAGHERLAGYGTRSTPTKRSTVDDDLRSPDPIQWPNSEPADGPGPHVGGTTPPRRTVRAAKPWQDAVDELDAVLEAKDAERPPEDRPVARKRPHPDEEDET